MNRKEMDELAKRRFSRRVGGSRSPETGKRTGGQVLNLLLEDELEIQQQETQVKPQIVLYLREGVNPADRNFTKVPNDMYPLARDLLTPFEEVLYRWAWRKSWGYGKNYCRFSRQSAFRDTSLNSESTTRRAIEGLRKKNFIVQALDVESNPEVNKDGKLYRVFTPAEVLNGKTDEGISLEDIPFNGVFCESRVTQNHAANPDETYDKLVGSHRTRVVGNQVQTEPGQTEPPSWVSENLVQTEPGEPDADGSKGNREVVHTEPGQTDPPLKEDSLKDSLSEDPVKLFYTGIGQQRISKVKREKGNSVLQELQKEGFSPEDIQFAIEWTLAPKNTKEKVHDFSIISHTIGQALATKEATQQAAESVRKEEAGFRAAEEEQRRLEGEIEDLRSELSKAELAELREQAEREIAQTDGMKKEFVNEPLIVAKENEILRRNDQGV